MAAIIIACLTCGLSSLTTKHRAKKAREQEYHEHFEELKAENAKRVRNMSGASMIENTYQNNFSSPNVDVRDYATGRSSEHESTRGLTGSGLSEPPKYDEIVTGDGVRGSRGLGRMGRTVSTTETESTAR